MAELFEFSRAHFCENLRCKIGMLKLEALTRMIAQDVERALREIQAGATCDAERTLRAIVDRARTEKLLPAEETLLAAGTPSGIVRSLDEPLLISENAR